MKTRNPDPAPPAVPAVPLAVIGLGCLFPQADGLEAYWANIKNGVDCITEVPASHWNPDDYYDPDPAARDKVYARRGGFLNPVEFDPLEFGISPRDIEAIDTTQLLGLVAARLALEDAGYGLDRDFNRDRASVILGVTGALEMVVHLGARLGHPHWRRALAEAGLDHEVIEDVVQRISDSYVEWQENSFPGLLGNVTAGRIANRLDLGGTNCVVDAACASSFSALHLAGLELAAGRADLVVTGGLDTFNDVFMYACFSKTPALSPTSDARPFDESGDGTILGEGLGVVVLKRLADAERDRDKIYAIIKSVGTSSDGKGTAVYAPNPQGQVKALRRAYDLAGITPDTLELIEAHGTGTVVGDGMELAALTEVFSATGRTGSWCALGSVKSQIGHTKAAAGAAGLIKAVLALRHKVLPPTLKVTRPLEPAAPGHSPLYINTEARPWLPSAGHPRRAGVSSFGFGGSNYHVVLEEYGRDKTAPDWDGRVQILAFSAESPELLGSILDQWPAGRSWTELSDQTAASRREFNPQAPCRLLIAVEKDRTDVARVIRQSRERLAGSGGQAAWQTPEGAFYGCGSRHGQLVFLFSGQGSQYPGMLRDLTCLFPQMLETLAEADEVFARHGGALADKRLSDYLYPLPAFTEERRAGYEAALRDTRVAQPALGAVGLGLFRVLEDFGLAPDLVAGHSYGELLALCASGRYKARELHRLSNLRGTLMADHNGHKGAMLALRVSAEEAEALIGEHGLKLVVANKNAPRQTVLSGLAEEIEKAAAAFEAKGVHGSRLNVSTAFHSPWMAHARGPFRVELQKIEFASPRFPVYANSTAEPYPDDPDGSRDLLAGQLVQPVEFVREIENMYGAGVRTYLEVGPGRTLTGLVASILEGRDFTALAVDSSRGRRSGVLDLALVLAQLAAAGHPVRLEAWAPARKRRDEKKDRPHFTVPLCGANQFTPRPARPPRAPAADLSRETTSPAPITTLTLRPESAPAEDKQVPRPLDLVAGPSPDLAEALRLTQLNMTALQEFQAKTAELHQRFLEGQEEAHRTWQALINQQQRLLEAAFGQVGPVAFPSVRAVPVQEPQPVRSAKTAETRPAPAAPVPPPPAAAVDRAHIEKILLEVVARHTGYPVEMLALEMGLDTDLGIDSIKRVEILSALAERLPEAPEVGPEHLGGLQTLGQVASFLASREGPAPAAGPAGPDREEVTAALLEVVARFTGYPVEMLSLEMGLDTDLGIDSIKRVEIFSALTERLPETPEVGPEHLGALKTLADVVEFLSHSATPAAPAGPADRPDDPVFAALLEAVAGRTGYPAETLRPDSELEAELGLDPVGLLEVIALVERKLGAIADLETGRLTGLGTLGRLAVLLREVLTYPEQFSPRAPDRTEEPLMRLVPEAVKLEVARPAKTGPPAGATVLVAGDKTGLGPAVAEELEARGFTPRLVNLGQAHQAPEPTAGLILLPPAGGTDGLFLRRVFELVKEIGPALRRSAREGASFLAAVMRLDGRFGLAGLEAKGDPYSGGLAGLAKTVAREWPEMRVRAVDLAPGLGSGREAARALVDEIFSEGPLETGLAEDGRFGLHLSPRPQGQVAEADLLSPGEVVVVTGGARGVTAEAAVALARAWRPVLALLGRSPAPEPEPEWLVWLNDEAAIKKVLLERSEEPLTPRELETRYRRVAANREMLDNLTRMQSDGARVVYRSVDVRDAGAVARVISEVREEFGPVRGLVHGAGVLADKLILEKTADQFETVFSTKVNGLEALLAATGEDEFRFLALFSSSTGRFGRAGQADYAAANEVLNKKAQALARRRPGCRVVSFNWGPWEGGMVTPGLKKVFQEEGLGLIPFREGAEFLVRELAAPAGPVEIVVLGPGTVLDGIAFDSAGPPAPAASNRRLSLSLDRFPFLESHVLDGQAVLPLAVMIEWLGRQALDSHPDLKLAGLDDFKVLARLAFDGGETVPVRLDAGAAGEQGGRVLVPVRLVRVAGQAETLIASSVAVLAGKIEEAKARIELGGLEPYPDPDSIYADGRLFHGPDLRAFENIEGYSAEGLAAWCRSAPGPEKWIKDPPWPGWLTDPLVLDAAFQMMSLWSRQTAGLPSLPVSFKKLRLYTDRFPGGGLRIVIRITGRSGRGVFADIELSDRAGNLVARIEGQTALEAESLIQAYRRNQLAGPPFPAAVDQAAGAV
ncbi:MAG: SDR family NAD(P)-dependent oxidoreductase [Thermodesulfobacteriota bacterium]